MIRLKGLTKSYGTLKALDGLNLEVRRGELFAFLGPNGAGKSTTIRILNGITSLDSGEAWIGGVDIAREPLKAKRLCGMVAQHNSLDGELTVAENLEIHGRLFGMSRGERRESSAELLRYVEMEDRTGALAKTLSGGLKRRLMIARALVHRPRLLFLDEPTVGLDPAIRRRIWSLIKSINREGVTVFLTTHYIEEAEFLADRVAFMNAGRLVETCEPKVAMARLGNWAVDAFEGGEMSTRFFSRRSEAGDYIRSCSGSGSVRRVNLEDAFMALTGRRVS
ncbi:MAG: ABC transporter ATP-binding protein [Deltaproteobacteria bacterium]|jgi:ABC-2 type transport system ATP-binding protein|nr:ABC transporter ATP-binding protein [Deltaproteobacteria bacterium]